MASNIVATVLIVGAGAMIALLLWPAVVAAAAKMKAPGAAGYFIFHEAFEANPKL